MISGRKKPITPDVALQRLEGLCAVAERCSWELKQKLKTWGVSARDSKKILDSLTERKFLDETRFAAAFVRDKYRFSKWGRAKIKAALYVRRIPQWLVEHSMEEIDEDEYKGILVSFLQSRVRMMKEEANSYDGRTKLFRQAASRGYEPSLIASILKTPSFWKEDEDEEDEID